MFTRVIHIKDAPAGWQNDPQYVYVGRTGRGLAGYFGNPFPLNGNARGSTLASFGAWAVDRMAHDKQYRLAVKALSGKTLVCFCAPLKCHGHVLAELADQ